MTAANAVITYSGHVLPAMMNLQFKSPIVFKFQKFKLSSTWIVQPERSPCTDFSRCAIFMGRTRTLACHQLPPLPRDNYGVASLVAVTGAPSSTGRSRHTSASIVRSHGDIADTPEFMHDGHGLCTFIHSFYGHVQSNLQSSVHA